MYTNRRSNCCTTAPKSNISTTSLSKFGSLQTRALCFSWSPRRRPYTTCHTTTVSRIRAVEIGFISERWSAEGSRVLGATNGFPGSYFVVPARQGCFQILNKGEDWLEALTFARSEANPDTAIVGRIVLDCRTCDGSKLRFENSGWTRKGLFAISSCWRESLSTAI
jgi:hypothetical protein